MNDPAIRSSDCLDIVAKAVKAARADERNTVGEQILEVIAKLHGWQSAHPKSLYSNVEVIDKNEVQQAILEKLDSLNNGEAARKARSI